MIRYHFQAASDRKRENGFMLHKGGHGFDISKNIVTKGSQGLEEAAQGSG